MGASYSKTPQYVQFTCRSEYLDWNEYISAGWRCPRSAELDKFGGLARPAIERGRSITAKLDFLRDSVEEQAQEIEDAIARANAVPEHLKSNLGKPISRTGTIFGSRPQVFLEAVLDPSTKQKPPAEWRLRTHAARRRIILMLGVIQRLKAGVKQRRRLRRVDSFSYIIQDMLKDDLSRFATLSQQLDRLEGDQQEGRQEDSAPQTSTSAAAAGDRAAANDVCTAATSRVFTDVEVRVKEKKEYKPKWLGFGSRSAKEVQRPVIRQAPPPPPPPALEKAGSNVDPMCGHSRMIVQRRKTTDGGSAFRSPKKNDFCCKDDQSDFDFTQAGLRRSSMSGSEYNGDESAAAVGSVRPGAMLPVGVMALRRSVTSTGGAVGGDSCSSTGSVPLFSAVGSTSRYGHTPAVQRSLLPQRVRDLMSQQFSPKRFSESGILNIMSNSRQERVAHHQLDLIYTATDSDGTAPRPLIASTEDATRGLSNAGLSRESSLMDAIDPVRRASASGCVRTSVSGVPGGGAGSQRRSASGQPGDMGSFRRHRTMMLHAASVESSRAPSVDGSICPASPTRSTMSTYVNAARANDVDTQGAISKQSTSHDLHIGGLDDDWGGDSSPPACRAASPRCAANSVISAVAQQSSLLPCPPATGPCSTDSPTPPPTPPPASMPPHFMPSPPRPRPGSTTHLYIPSPPTSPVDVKHTTANNVSSASPAQHMHLLTVSAPPPPGAARPPSTSLSGRIPSPVKRSPIKRCATANGSVSGGGGVIMGSPVQSAGSFRGRPSTSLLRRKLVSQLAAADALHKGGEDAAEDSDDAQQTGDEPLLPGETKEERARRIELIAAQRRVEAAWELELAQREGKAWEDMTQEEARKLMTMYINRANAQWSNSKTWSTPAFWDATKQQEWAGTEEFTTWKDTVIDDLKQGNFVVQVHCSGQTFECQEVGRSYDLYSTCPWDLLNMWKPHASSQASNKICGVPWGVRVLAGMACAIESVGGREALEATPVILHLNEDDWEQQVSMLRAYNFCGLSTKNIFILTQKSVSGYTYDPDLRRFVQCEDAATTVVGSGYGLMQLNWTSEAKTVDEDGVPQLLHGTVLEELQDRGCKWLVSHPLRDMCLVSAASWLDLLLLPFLAACHEVGGAAGMTQVTKQDNVNTLPRADCSLVLGCAHGLRPKGRPAAGHPVHSVSPIRELRACEVMAGSAKGLIRAGAKLDTGHYLLGLDRHVFALDKLAGLLMRPDVVRPKLTVRGKNVFMHLHVSDVTGHDSLKTVAVEARNGPTWLNTPSDLEDLLPLITAQDNNGQFRRIIGNRKLSSRAELPGPGGSALLFGNTTAMPSGFSISAGGTGITRVSNTGSFVTSPGSALMGVPGQISSPPRGFSRMSAPGPSALTGLVLPAADAAGYDPGYSSADMSPRGVSSPRAKPRPIVVFISSSAASSLAVDAAIAVSKPGRDVVHLVTVVSSHMHVEAGYNLLDTHVVHVSRAMIDATTQVLVQDVDNPELISTMGKYVDNLDAQLVVMATKMLHSNVINTSSILGSVTLAALKRFQVPMLIVNQHSTHVGDALRGRSVRAMAVVHRSSKPLVQLLCSEVLQPSRGDSLVICRVEEPSQQTPSTNVAGPTVLVSSKLDQKLQQSLLLQRAVASMSQVALMSGLQQPSHIKVDGEDPDVLNKVATQENVHLIGYILPSQVGKVPDHLVKLLHGCKSAVLVCRHTAQVSQWSI